MLTTHGAARTMPAQPFGAYVGGIRLGAWGPQLESVAGRRPKCTNGTAINVGRPTSSPDRWTG